VIVLKFGGTSVGDAEAIERAAAIVRTRADAGPIVVVSALAGVSKVSVNVTSDRPNCSSDPEPKQWTRAPS
jgi:aspartokinase